MEVLVDVGVLLGQCIVNTMAMLLTPFAVMLAVSWVVSLFRR